MSLFTNPFTAPESTYEMYERAVTEHAARGIHLDKLTREQWEIGQIEVRKAFGLNSGNFFEILVFAPVSIFSASHDLGMEWLPVMAVVSGLAWALIFAVARKAIK